MPKFCMMRKTCSLGSNAGVPHDILLLSFEISITSIVIQRWCFICSIVIRLDGCRTSIFLMRVSHSKKKPVKSIELLRKVLIFQPVLRKNGIRNLPDKTRSLKDCNVDPSNGSAPQTKTYKTTPSD